MALRSLTLFFVVAGSSPGAAIGDAQQVSVESALQTRRLQGNSQGLDPETEEYFDAGLDSGLLLKENGKQNNLDSSMTRKSNNLHTSMSPNSPTESSTVTLTTVTATSTSTHASMGETYTPFLESWSGGLLPLGAWDAARTGTLTTSTDSVTATMTTTSETSSISTFSPPFPPGSFSQSSAITLTTGTDTSTITLTTGTTVISTTERGTRIMNNTTGTSLTDEKFDTFEEDDANVTNTSLTVATSTTIRRSTVGESSCLDNDAFIDARGWVCSDWARLPCQEAESLWEYPKQEVYNILLNCKVSCGQCDYIAGSSTTVVSTTGSSPTTISSVSGRSSTSMSTTVTSTTTLTARAQATSSTSTKRGTLVPTSATEPEMMTSRSITTSQLRGTRRLRALGSMGSAVAKYANRDARI